MFVSLEMIVHCQFQVRMYINLEMVAVRLMLLDLEFRQLIELHRALMQMRLHFSPTLTGLFT